MTHPLALIKRQRYVSPSIDTIISTSTYGGDVIGYYTSGTVTYAVHIFNKSGTFTLPSISSTNTVEVLLVGGGGSGGGSKFGGGGGGGGGGFVITSTYQLSVGVPVAIEIGAGATASTSNNAFAQGNNGSPSTIGTGTANYVVALGGGGGGSPGQVPYLSSYSTATLSGLSGGQGGGAAGTNLNASFSGYFNTNGTYLRFTSTNFNVSATDVVWTMECWVYMVTSNTYFFCIGNGSTFGNAMACGLNSSNYFIFTQGNGSSNPVSITSSITYSLNTWYHYAVSRTSSGLITLFINGRQQGSQTYNSAVTGAGTTVVINGLYDNSGIGNTGGQFYISNLRFVKGISLYNYNIPNVVPTAILTTGTTTALLLTTPNNSNYLTDTSVNNLTVTSSLTTSTTSSFITPFLSSLYFGTTAGTNYIRINPAPQFRTNNFTIEGWFYFYGGNTLGVTHFLWEAGVINGSGNYQGKMYIAMNGTNLSFGWVSSSGSGSVNYAATSLSTRWNHIALVKTGAGTNQTTVYVNGISAITATVGDMTYSASNFVFDVGNNPESGSWSNQFLLSNFRILNGIAVYTTTFTVPTRPLTTTQSADVNGNPSAAISTGTYTTFLLNGPGTVDTSKNSTYSVTGSIPYVALSQPFTTSSYVLYCPGNTYITATPSRALGSSGGNYTIEMWIWVGGLSSNISNYDFWLFGPTSNNANVAPYWNITANTTGASISASFSFLNPNLTGGGGASYSTTDFLYKWAHIALTRVGSTGYLWLNGVNVASGGQSVTPTTTGVVFVGGYSNSGRSIPGEMYIRDFRITAGVAVYTSTFTPPTNTLTTTQSANVNGNPSVAINTATWVSWLVSPTGQTITDSSTYGLAITSSGSYVQLARGPYDTTTSTEYGSLLLIGTGYLSLANPTQLAFGTNNFSIEAWVYPINWGGSGNNFLFDFRPTGTDGAYPSLYFDGSGIPYYYVNSAVQITGTALTVNTWNHVVIIRVNGTTGLILNGTVNSSVYIDSNTYLVGSGRPIIGSSGFSAGTSSLRAIISNVHITNGSSLPYTLPLFTAPTKFLETTQLANISGSPSSAITTSTSTILLTFQRYGNNQWDVPNESPYSYSMTFVGTNSSYGFMGNPYYGTNGNIQPFTSYDNILSGSAGTSIQFSTIYTSLGPSTLEYIIVGGGGGGGGGGTSGFGAGGGGGAGGIVSGSMSPVVDETISITVGAGGSGAASFTYGTNGGNSTLVSSSGSKNLTAYGGGGAGYGDVTGLSGGSGGGPSGTSNQLYSTTFGYGNSGGSSQSSNGYGGAGGGAGTAGLNYNAGTGQGNGGAGLLYSNYGSWGTDANNSTTATSGKGYFGGGGASGNWYIQGTRTGGVGGGGNGQSNSTGLPGQPYTGGGGAGGAGNAGGVGGGNGGSGIVIVRYLSTYSSGIVTGNPTVSTTGSYIYYAFTSTGSISWASTLTTTYSGGTAALGSWASGGGGGGGAGGNGGNGGYNTFNGGSYGGIGARYGKTGAYYAGGGAGAPYFGGTSYTGGFGGGADANTAISDYVPYTGVGIAGQPNTGGGGSTKTTSGAGGSGIVIVSYPLPTTARFNNRIDPYFNYNTLLLSTTGDPLTYDFPVSPGTITATSSRLSSPPPWVEILVVGGGGGGGRGGGTLTSGGGGGGGGGAILTTATITPSGASTTVVVGAGGQGGTGATAGLISANGSNSSAWGYTAIGGGAGGNANNASDTSGNGENGGSGGGGAGSTTLDTTAYSANSYGIGGSGQTEDSSYPFQGYGGGVGGRTATGSSNPPYGRGAGAGGGAGAVGGDGGALTTSTGNSSNASGSGGTGLYCPWSSYGGYYGGGGGGGYSSGTGAAAGGGGAGGGGAGGTAGATGTAGTNGLGGGGGGGGSSSTGSGGKGGTGTVIVRYLQIYSTATVTGSPTISVDRGYRYYSWTLPGSFSMSFPSQLTTLTNLANVLYLDSSINNCTVTSLSQNVGGSPYQGTFTPYSNAWSVYFAPTSNAGRGMSFNTGTQFVYGTSAVTIEAWIFPIRNESINRALFRQPDNSSNPASQLDMTILSSTSGMRVTWGNTTILTSTIPVVYSTWQHVAFVREGSGTNQAKLYINGVLGGVGTASYNHTVTTDFPTIGSQYSPWVGYISNFRIVNGTAVYVGGTTTGTTYFSPPTSPLSRINGTSLLSCADHLFVDKSVYNNQLTTSTTYAAFTATSNASVYFANISKFSPFSKYGKGARIGGSAYFPGSGGGEASYLNVVGSSVNTLNLSTTTNWTIECWFYCTKITMADQQLIDKDGNSSTAPSYAISISAGTYVGATTSTVKALIGQSGVATSYGNYVIGINRWYHVAFVQTSGSVYFYVNGTLNATSLTRTMGNQNNNLFIGWRDNQAWGNHFNGYLSDIRITRRAVYTAEFNPPILPLQVDSNTIMLLNFTNYKIMDYTGNYNLLPRGTMSTTSVVKNNRSSMRFNGYDHMQFLPVIPDYSRYRAGLMTLNSQFTVETWIYITSFNSGQDSSGFWNIIYGDTDNGSDSNAWFFGFNQNGRPAWYNVSDASINYTSYVLPLNTWFHLAWVSVYSSAAASSSISLYINGQLQPLYQSTSTSYITGQANQEFRPGIGMDRGRGFWSGYLEDLRVTQGIARYTQNFVPPDGPLPKG